MEVKVFGRVIVFKPLAFRKADSLISVTPLGTERLVRLSHLSKHQPSITVTVVGISTVLRL